MNSIITGLAEQRECFYLYDAGKIKDQIRKLRTAFPQIDFLYSIKSNSNKGVMKTVFSCGLGADAASLGEVMLAQQSGLNKENIYFSAPGKTSQEIEQAINRAEIIADSLTEISRISAIAGKTQRSIGIRINPDFSFDSTAGTASKFGIDEKEVLRYLQSEVPDNVRINGIHVHVKSQELNSEKLKSYYRNMLMLAENVEAVLGYQLNYINMGSGIGIAYSETDTEIDIDSLGNETENLFSEFRKTHPNTRLMIETGRYVVCQSGVYVTHVVDRKESHGKTYIILKNTLNGYVRPSLARMVDKYDKESSIPCEPLYSGADSFSFYAPYQDREKEIVSLVGNLCTAADVIAEDITMPYLQTGDILVINNAGAYAAVISPIQFSSQTAPTEYLLHEDGSIETYFL